MHIINKIHLKEALLSLERKKTANKSTFTVHKISLDFFCLKSQCFIIKLLILTHEMLQ